MIIKELDPFHGTDKFQLAGRHAEEQMAFYLRRYFADTEDVYVINGLNLGKDGESLQIDHLVIHQHGLFIIESKSVSGKIVITNDHQWIRKYRDNASGMKSPIIQVEMQKMLLMSIIEELASEHRCMFPINDIEQLIAISDNGIIEWPDEGPISGVYKADQICKKIQFYLAQNRTKKVKKISEMDIPNWIKSNITEKKHSHAREVTHPDTIMEPRGNFPQWVAEFFCECHEIHMKMRNNVIPVILLEYIPKKTIETIETLDAYTKRQVSEIFTYALVWRKIFEARNACFTYARTAAILKILHPNGTPLVKISRSQRIPKTTSYRSQ